MEIGAACSGPVSLSKMEAVSKQTFLSALGAKNSCARWGEHIFAAEPYRRFSSM